jgi:integrase
LREDDRYFPGVRSERFSDRGLVKRAVEAWEAADLAPVGLHDARHTFASYLIDAGVNA